MKVKHFRVTNMYLDEHAYIDMTSESFETLMEEIKGFLCHDNVTVEYMGEIYKVSDIKEKRYYG